MKSVLKKSPAWVWWIYLITILLFYIPLLGLFIGAFVKVESGQWQWTSQWFMEVFQDDNLTQGLLNSLIIGGSASALSTLMGTAAAIGLKRSRGWDGQWLQGLSFLSLFLPEIVLALSMLSWFYILQFELGYWTVIMAHVTLTISYVLLTVGARLGLLDQDLEDAAADLGAGSFKTLWYVTLPLLKPAIFSGFLLSFLISFDDFLITFFVNGIGQDTLPIKLYSAMKMGLSPKLNALSTLMLFITIAVLLLFFKNPAFRDLLQRDEE
jgi:spermidine/putrescine transport system permease protein